MLGSFTNIPRNIIDFSTSLYRRSFPVIQPKPLNPKWTRQALGQLALPPVPDNVTTFDISQKIDDFLMPSLLNDEGGPPVTPFSAGVIAFAYIVDYVVQNYSPKEITSQHMMLADFFNAGKLPQTDENFEKNLRLIIRFCTKYFPDALFWLFHRISTSSHISSHFDRPVMMNFADCRLNGDDIKKIAEWLATFPEKFALDFSDNNIDSEDANMLFSALKGNEKIVLLVLQNNKLDKGETADALKQLRDSNPELLIITENG